MREEIEEVILEELQKVQPSIESYYDPASSEIQDKIDQQNKKIESELVSIGTTDSQEEDVTI